MKVRLIAVGRLRDGPERVLVDDYLERATLAGRALSLGPVTETEIDDRKNRTRAEQSEKIAEHLDMRAISVCLDERGTTMSSPEFSRLLERLRDDGTPETCLLIGGADGHSQNLRDNAAHRISLGPMVWPHMLVRVMVAEQIYRAIAIAAGKPYHRD
ncbi:MAG: 23S rRNA (pseudouridine(1915)-N(3))-methyltransferase RlmH [Pseudomonadota bacterium]